MKTYGKCGHTDNVEYINNIWNHWNYRWNEFERTWLLLLNSDTISHVIEIIWAQLTICLVATSTRQRWVRSIRNRWSANRKRRHFFNIYEVPANISALWFFFFNSLFYCERFPPNKKCYALICRVYYYFNKSNMFNNFFEYANHFVLDAFFLQQNTTPHNENWIYFLKMAPLDRFIWHYATEYRHFEKM